MPATCLVQCLRDQDRAFENFFTWRKRYPKFKQKRVGGSLRFQDIGTAWSRGVLSLPKLGPVKLAEALPQLERPDALTLSRDSLDRREDSKSKRLEAHLRYLRQQQRCLARRQKGSKRREKQRLRVARIHAAIRQERHAAVHALTTRLVREFDIIAIEHLNVKGLARGRNARAVRDAAFGEIRRQLLYKSDAAGRIPLEVDQWFPSSKMCWKCRHLLDELRLDQRQWACPRCGTVHDRDINAARNILLEGLREIAGCDDRDLRVDARGACPERSLSRRRCSQTKRETGTARESEREQASSQ